MPNEVMSRLLSKEKGDALIRTLGDDQGVWSGVDTWGKPFQCRVW